MASNTLVTRRRPHRQQQRPRDRSSSEEIEMIPLDDIPSSTGTPHSTTILIPSSGQVKQKEYILINIIISKENETVDESPLVKIIKKKKRKDW